jgi:Amt family ammonium transporter
LSVHLVNGVFGTLCVGLFADPSITPAAASLKPGLFLGGGMAQLLPQIEGIVAVGAFTLAISLVAWAIIKAAFGLRVSAAEEIEGLDSGEHAASAYPDFLLAESREA